MVEFQIDPKKREQLSKKIVTASVGGKIAIGLGFLCLVLMVVVPCYLMIFTSGFLSDDGPLFDAIMAGSFFGLCAFFLFVCTYRQRNARLAIRLNERLYIDNGFLYYFYHCDNDVRHNIAGGLMEYGVSSYAVDLRNTKIKVGDMPSQYFFEGGVHCHRYVNQTSETAIVSISEMERVDDNNRLEHLEMYDYWTPNLREAIIEEQKRAQTSGYEQSHIDSQDVFPEVEPEQVCEEQPVPVQPKSSGSPVIPYVAAGALILALLWGLSVGRWYSLVMIPFIWLLITEGNNRRQS